MGEDNILINKHLHIKAKELLDGGVPHQVPNKHPTSYSPHSNPTVK